MKTQLEACVVTVFALFNKMVSSLLEVGEESPLRTLVTESGENTASSYLWVALNFTAHFKPTEVHLLSCTSL